MTTLRWFREIGTISLSSIPTAWVFRQDRGVWRHLFADDTGDVAVHGPAYASKIEAFATLSAAWSAFAGEDI